MKYESHLLVEEVSLAAGQEWAASSGAWHVLRVNYGEGYWLDRTQSYALSQGDMLVLAPGASGRFRASLIGELHLHAFAFDPARLCGLLSFAERQYFAQQVRTAPPARVFPATHAAALTFAALVGEQHGLLGERARILAVLGEIFDGDLARDTAIIRGSRPARQRFHDLIHRMPEIELLRHTSEELGRLCGCTGPHFSRLFRKQFGTSPRARQTELRLDLASQLLLESETKIIDVAFESGYRSLSLFNAVFKRRYKMTPSAWRRKNVEFLKKQTRAAAAAVALAFTAMLPLRGAEAVAPGPVKTNAPATKGNEASGAATATKEVTFEVKGYALDGNTLLPEAVTTPLLQKHTGPAVSFETIRKALADLQMAYRDRGYITVAVALPPQQLTNGIVHVQVTEGRLMEIVVHGNRYFSSNNVMRALPSLHTNSLLNSLVFQQELDRANANRDRQIYPVINPGPEPGTSALELKVKDRLPVHGRVELDNYSTPNTPELRANAAIQYNNLWQLEHQVGLQYSFSPEDYKSGNFPFYDLPLIASYSAFYRMPLSPVNGPTPTRDYEAGDFGYDEVTHRFRPPPVREGSELIFYASRSSIDTGHILQSETLTPPTIPPEGALQVQDQIFNRSLTVNENLGARWSLPLPDLGALRSSLSLGPDFKNFRIESTQDRTFQATVFVPEVGQVGPPFTQFPSPPTSSSRSLFNSVQYLPVTLLWEGSARDKWGSTSLSLNQSANYGELLGDSDDFRAIAGSKKANGNYYLLMAGATREQKLFGDWGLRLHADGQWANQPLISNEQFALGGLAGVRGYRDGEEYGDTGWRVQFEPHTPVLTAGVVNGVPVTARLFTFVDYGERYLIDPGPRPGSVQMLGLGGGLDSSIGSHVDFRIATGVPALDVPGRKSGDARVYFTVSAQY
jgi:hemolysin activation/secretion protein/AraC-like DNA-binding protein